MPVIRQAIVGRGAKLADQDAFERKLLAIRKQTQNPLARPREEAQAAGPDRALHAVASRRRTVVYKGLLLAPPGRQLLRRPAQSADCESALGLVHQRFSTNTFPSLEAGAPLPLHRPQRRDQHGARQRQLDERAPPHDGIGPARRRPRQDVAADPARPVGHRLPRQRARAAGRRRLLAGARDDDADPGGLGRQSADGCQAQAPSTSITPR